MILPKPIKKVIAVFRGKVSPLMIVLSVLLGFWFGLTPGFSGLHAGIIIIAVVLNINLGLFLILSALGKTLAIAGAPALYHTGVLVADKLPLLLKIFSNIPIVAYTDFGRFSVAGALILGPAVGLVLGLVLSNFVKRFRRRWISLAENSEKFNKWYSKKWVQVLDRILIGKSAKDPKETLEGRGPIIRMPGVIVAVIIIAGIIIGSMFIPNEKIRQQASMRLTEANGAEVNISQVELAPVAGKFAAEGVQVTDPQKPEYNKFAVEKVSAKADITGLLMGKVILDEVKLSSLTFDTQRAEPGKVYHKPADEKPKPKLPDMDAASIEKYIQNGKKVKQWLQKISQYLPDSKDKSPVKPDQIPENYLQYLTASADRPAAPRFIAKLVEMEDVRIPLQFLGNSIVKLKNVSDAPQAAALPVRIEINSQESDASLDLSYDFSASQDSPNVKGTFAGFDISSLSSGSPVSFESGIASGSISGTMLSNIMDLAVDINLKNLTAGKSSQLFKVNPEITSEIISQLEQSPIRLRIIGTPASPSVALEDDQLMKRLQDAMLKQGEQKAKQELEKAIKDKVSDKSDIDPDAVVEGIKGLFGGKKENSK